MADPVSYPPVTPYVLYEDASAALEWLCRVFGFRERLRYATDDGTVNHAEVETASGGLIMLGAPGPGFRGPAQLGGVTVLLHVYVDDVDAHYDRAVAAGATIVRPPADESYGDRRYDAEDLAGHQWSFAQRVAEPLPEDWGATAG